MYGVAVVVWLCAGVSKHLLHLFVPSPSLPPLRVLKVAETGGASKWEQESSGSDMDPEEGLSEEAVGEPQKPYLC